jgi:hypothetical protein
MHPQAIVVDGSKVEDEYFLKGIRHEAVELKTTVIELPEHAGKSLNWFTKLDSSSLAGMQPVISPSETRLTWGQPGIKSILTSSSMRRRAGLEASSGS